MLIGKNNLGLRVYRQYNMIIYIEIVANIYLEVNVIDKTNDI